MSTMENLVLGALALLLLLWMLPSVRPAMERSKNLPTDWQSVLLPIGLVVMFVIFLIATV